MATKGTIGQIKAERGPEKYRIGAPVAVLAAVAELQVGKLLRLADDSVLDAHSLDLARKAAREARLALLKIERTLPKVSYRSGNTVITW